MIAMRDFIFLLISSIEIVSMLLIFDQLEILSR